MPKVSALGRGLVIIIGAVLGAVVGLVVGAFAGGNLATRFELFELRGYEATGIVGLAVGMLLGGVAGALLGRRSAR